VDVNLSFNGVTFSLPSVGMGCENWADIQLFTRSEPTAEACAERCAYTSGCEGFGHQSMPSADCGDGGVDQFSCVLFFGRCKESANSCFDNYVVVDSEHRVDRAAEESNLSSESSLGASANCGPKMPGDNYTVAVIFAGRRNYMHMLVHYVDQLVKECYLDEVHVWDFTKDSLDAGWLEKVIASRPAYQLLHPEGDIYWNPTYHYYAAIDGAEPKFKPRWQGASRDRTVLVKIDDDVVYLDTSRFPSFVDYVRSHKEKFIVHANTINNGVASYYQAHHIERLGTIHPGLLDYPTDEDDPDRTEAMPVTPGRYGLLLRNSSISADLHRDFLAHMSEYSWDDPVTGPCITYRMNETSTGQGRFSINVFGVLWSAWDLVNELVTEDFATNTVMPEDERVLTVDATEHGNQECMYTPFLVSHWSFGCQHHPIDLLHRYEELVIDRGPPSESDGGLLQFPL
jgi:hypothetical protein